MEKFEKYFRPGWKCSKYRRRHQRVLNKAMRRINKCVAEDELWRGRFVVRCVDTYFERYQSSHYVGYEMKAALEFRDKKTGFTSVHIDDVNSIVFLNAATLWRWMNDFIMEEANVWAEGRDVIYSNTIDYTKID